MDNEFEVLSQLDDQSHQSGELEPGDKTTSFSQVSFCCSLDLGSQEKEYIFHMAW